MSETHYYPPTPREVPVLRDELIQLWTSPIGLHLAQEEVKRSHGHDEAEPAEHYRQNAIKILREAGLYWVSPEMCELLKVATESLPETVSITFPDLPTPKGFVVLATPIPGLDVADPENKSLCVAAFGWTPCFDYFNPVAREKWFSSVDAEVAARSDEFISFLRIETYDDLMRLPVLLQGPERQRKVNSRDAYRLLGSRLFILGSSAWGHGDPWQLRTPLSYARLDEHTWRSIYEDRKLVAAFVNLVQQRIVTVERREPNNAERKQALRRKSEPSPINLVTLRRRSHEGIVPEHRQVDWSHRWIVSAHWRHQWYPSTKEHKLKLIPAYQKGPEDKPLAHRDTVRMWVR